MNNQAFYIWLQQGQDLWDQIQNFIIHNKDIIIVSFGTGSLLAIVRFIWWVVQQNRKLKLLPDTFPFEVIKPQSNALQILLGGNENDPLADYKIPYQDRVPGRNTQDELKQKLDQHRWLLILAPTGWGKTREAANLADRLNNEGWTILKLKGGKWLEAPPIFPEDKIGTDRKLLFFLDDLNNKMSGGRIEQSPKADDPLQPLNKPLQERLFNTLQAYEKFCRKEDIRIIATARNEKEREFLDESSEWEKLEFDKYPLWKRFEIYNLPEPNEEAIEAYEAAIKITPDYYKAWHHKGVAFAKLKKYEEAIEAYEAAIKIKPEDHEIWNNKGNALTNLEKYEEAIEAYEAAIKIKPDYHEAWHNKGVALFNLEQYQEAISSLITTLSIKPNDYEIWNNMGALLANLGEHQKAINSYNIALNINPHLHKTWYNTACSYVLIGNIDQAIYNLEQAINLNPEECRESATNDSVFDNIRNDPRFQALLQE